MGINPRIMGAVLCAWLIVPVASGSAQNSASQVSPGYVVKQWLLEDGLPGNSVRDIVQTEDGYLWMATGNGLARFDGNRFSTFSTANTPALPNNRLSVLYESKAGDLWILSEQFHLIRYRDGTFSRPLNRAGGRVSAVYKEASKGRFFESADSLWIATDRGLVCFHDGKLEPYLPEKIQARVWTLMRDRSGSMWLGTFSGDLLEVRPDETVHRYSTEDGLPGTRIHDIYEDTNGVLWVATPLGPYVREPGGHFAPWTLADAPWIVNVRTISQDSSGTYHFGLSQRVYVNKDRDAGWYSLRAENLSRFPAPEASIHFGRIPQTGPDGNIWRIQGNALYSGTRRVFLSPSEILSLQFDNENNAWIGTAADGLYRLRPATFNVLSVADGIPDRRVHSVLEDRDSRLWIGTEMGLATMRDGVVKKFDLYEGYKDLPSTFFPRKGYSRVRSPGQEIWGLLEDRSGAMWIGTNYEHCHIEDNRCLLVDLPDMPQDLYENVAAMHEDRLGRFWIGTKWGLVIGFPDRNGRAWTRYTTKEGLTNNWIQSIIETRKGSVLLGTYGGGLMRFDDGTFESFTTANGLSSDNILDLYEDEKELLWVGTEDRGLCRLERKGGLSLQQSSIRCIGVNQGLFDNTINTIVEDDFGRLWMSTSRGIFWVELSDLNALAEGERTSVNSVGYTEEDGLLNRQTNGGVQPAGIKASDGRLWFATQDGAAVVDPAGISRRSERLRVIIEGVYVGNDLIPVNNPVTIQAGERDIHVEYTALSFTRPEDIRFRYRLDGFDDDWKEAGSDRRATYTNVPPGKYTFHVVAGMGGAWQEPGAQLSINRKPFFWETKWFIALFLFLGGYVIFGLYRYRLRQVEARTHELERKVSERTEQIHQHRLQLEEQADELRRVNELKSRFLANISHEFRTPLSLTLGPLDDLEHGRFGSLPQPAKVEVGRVRRNARRLLRLINQLLDLSKLEAGKLTLFPREYDLARFVRQLTALFESTTTSRSIVLRVRTDPESIPFVFDSDRLEKVIVNLLSNACKFTPSGGSIDVLLRLDESGQAELTVSDTGEGIAAEHIPHLFDRFYQVDQSATRSHEGTGIGLALVKEFTELHGGQIEVESEIGVGTTFTVCLPKIQIGEDDSDAELEDDTSESTTDSEVLDVMTDLMPADNGTDPRSNDVREDDTLVLIVEDNTEMRDYIRSHLSGLFTIVEADNGATGLERARELIPDLILTDVMMPKMDGMALCDAIKSDERTSHIPVILLTARASEENKLAGIEIGADAYLEKPFNAEELRLRVGKLIDQRRSLRKQFSRQVLVLGASDMELPERESAFLEQIQQVIETQMGSVHFGVDALATEVALSRRQLLRKLKALIDETPTALIRRMRLERAAQLLSQGGRSAKEVAYMTGFQSVPYFTTAFREAYDLSPSAYSESALDSSSDPASA